MFLTGKRILLLHLGGEVIRTTADHPFYVHGQGWRKAGCLRPGDRFRTVDGRDVAVEAITDSGQQEAVYQLEADVPPYPCTGLWPAGTLLETEDGLKKIEDVKAGDYVVVRPPLDPESN